MWPVEQQPADGEETIIIRPQLKPLIIKGRHFKANIYRKIEPLELQ